MAGIMKSTVATQSWQNLSTRIGFALIVLGLMASAVLARAEGLQDPTRPPSVQSMAPGDTQAPVASGPQLQSIRISAYSASAIVSGKRVVVGERVGSAQVIAISENQIMLKTSNGVQTLKLFPGIGKSAVVRTSVPSHTTSRRSQ